MDNTEEAKTEIKIEDPDDGICDCNDEECEGCFWQPCESCSSNKCGHQCRINREWKYISWEVQGRNN